MIKYNRFSEKVQSLGYIPEGKMKSRKSVGIIEAGERHDFGVVDRLEKIMVTDGSGIIINGQAFYCASGWCTIEPGTQVVFDALGEEASTYLCLFPNETR